MTESQLTLLAAFGAGLVLAALVALIVPAGAAGAEAAAFGAAGAEAGACWACAVTEATARAKSVINNLFILRAQSDRGLL